MSNGSIDTQARDNLWEMCEDMWGPRGEEPAEVAEVIESFDVDPGPQLFVPGECEPEEGRKVLMAERLLGGTRRVWTEAIWHKGLAHRGFWFWLYAPEVQK